MRRATNAADLSPSGGFIRLRRIDAACRGIAEGDAEIVKKGHFRMGTT